MDVVHGQQREQEEVVLEIGKEIASWFIPMTWLTKLKYVKYAGRIFKWKRGVAATEKAVADGKYYSVIFETKIPSNLYPGKGATSHFKAANNALSEAMASDAAFANTMKEFNIAIPRTTSGTITGGKIPNWVWHHNIEPGVMQLVPQIQHTNGSIFWRILHLEGKGGCQFGEEDINKLKSAI